MFFDFPTSMLVSPYFLASLLLSCRNDVDENDAEDENVESLRCFAMKEENGNVRK